MRVAYRNLSALVVCVVVHAGLASESRDALRQHWTEQYESIQDEINRRDSGPKATAKSLARQAEHLLDPNMLILPSDRSPVDVAVRRTRLLIDDLQRMGLPRSKTARFRSRLDALQSSPPSAGLAKSSASGQYAAVSALHREAALSNPLLDFDSLLFVAMNPAGGHQNDQYFPWSVDQSAGGGIYILADFKSSSPRLINVTPNATIPSGRLAGQSLSGGAFLSPDLDFDGTRIAFAWSAVEPRSERCYHIMTVNVDGTNLQQLTDGHATFHDNNNWGWPFRAMDQSHHDFDPCWLPNGRIVFISERRGGYGRCHPVPKPTSTLYSMNDDGTDIIPISYHETNEWHPSVNNDGLLLYTRWDYLDRDDCIAHHLWTCYPDGRDPRAPHGNYPEPYTTMTGSNWFDGRLARPGGEWNIRAIPNSNKYVATAAGHHSSSFFALVMIDPTIPDDNGMSQVTKITPAPENEWAPSGYGDFGGWGYGTAWPLSEDYYICNKDETIVLRDRFGGEDLIFASSSSINNMRPIDPIPLRPRTRPPVIPTQTWQGERTNLPDHKRATISVVNVYEGDMPLPAGVKISAMRIMQVIPKYSPVINCPNVGYASEALVRMSLGTVPVEEDGSVYCEAPVEKEIYFQLLDERGLAVHSMRAGTYVHPGEQLSCVGCHEDKWKAVAPPTMVPLAFRRPPSKLSPDAGAEPDGFTPINYFRLVKPIFDTKCVSCHQQQAQGPQDMSYDALEPYSFHFCTDGKTCCDGFLKGDIISPIWGGSRTIPGMFGAYYSLMGKALLNDTHQNAGITDEEFKRVCLWLEGNSNQFGAYSGSCSYPFACDVQHAGEFVWPELDVDTLNPLGIESQYLAPGEPAAMALLNIKPSVGPRVIDVYGGRLRVVANQGTSLILRVFDCQGRCAAVRRVGDGDIVNRNDLGFSRGFHVVQLFSVDGRALGDACRLPW